MLTQTCCTHILVRNGYNYDYDISRKDSIGTSITRGILLLLQFDHFPSIPSKEGYDEVDGEVEEEGGEYRLREPSTGRCSSPVYPHDHRIYVITYNHYSITIQ